MAAVRRHAGRKTAIVALGVLVAGVLLSAVAWVTLRPSPGALRDPAAATSAVSGYFPGGSGCRPARIALLKGGRYYRPRLDRCAQAAESHRLQVEALKAQTTAAHAGWAQARLVYGLVRVLLAGTIFTGWILGAMLWAAWALSRRPGATEAPEAPSAPAPIYAAVPVALPAPAARPQLQLDGVSVSRREGAGRPNAFFVRLTWKNVGDAAAVIEDCVVGCDDLDQLPAQPDYAAGLAVHCPRSLGPGAAFETKGFGPAVIARAAASRDDRPVRVAVFGRLTYRDPEGRRHQTGFSMEVAPDAQAMRRLGDPAYEYAS